MDTGAFAVSLPAPARWRKHWPTRNMAPPPLHILHLEDNPADCELVAVALKRGELEANIRTTAQRDEYLAALQGSKFDLILSDYSLPGYDGTAALLAAQKHQPGTPFIFVSATMGEEVAVESLKHGATDYVLKESLARLAPAVRRALREVEEARARQEADEAMRQSEALLRSITHHTEDIIFVKDRAGRILFMNPAGLRANGHSLGELLGRTDAEWHHNAGEAARFMADDERVMASRHTETFEESFTAPDGKRHVFLTTKTPRLDPEGNVIGIMGIVHDITERKAGEEMVRASERRWRDLAEAMPQLVWTCTSDGQCDFLSKQWLDYTGIAEASQLGYGWLEQVHPDDRDRLGEAWIEAVTTRRLFDVEFRVRRHDGEYHWFKTRAVPVSDASGQIVKWFGSNTDIEDMKQAEAGLQRERNLLRTLIDLIPDPIFVRDADDRFLVANVAVAHALGASSPSEIIGRTDGDFFPAEVAASFRRDDERVFAGQSVLDQEEPVLFPDGRRRVLLTTKVPLQNIRGEVVGLVGIGRDITERKAGEEALLAARDAAERASKAKDEFLAALSHELRTPLTPVMLCTGALRTDPRLPQDVREQLEMVVRNISLEARLIDDLLDLTRIARGNLALRLVRCDAHLLLRQTREIVQNAIVAKDLEITEDFAAACAWIEADPTRLQQVFWNLLNNAVKFTPVRGRIRVATHNEGDRLIVQVTDTGIGIASEMCARIFEPFEQAGLANDHRFGGLGLGLAIAKAVVDQHHGSITVQSEGTGRGATFRVEMAAAAAPPATAPPAHAPADDNPPSIRPLRLLIVEDHEPTLQTLARLLGRGGHHITCAGSIATAIEAAQAATFDVLISDIGLPDGFGYELLPRLRALQPALEAIVLSGYGADEDIRKSRAAGYRIHLTKPVDFAELKRALHDIAPAAVI